jgi:hypothetical protein
VRTVELLGGEELDRAAVEISQILRQAETISA